MINYFELMHVADHAKKHTMSSLQETLTRVIAERDALKATLHKIATENLGAINDHDWKRRARLVAKNALRDLK